MLATPQTSDLRKCQSMASTQRRPSSALACAAFAVNQVSLDSRPMSAPHKRSSPARDLPTGKRYSHLEGFRLYRNALRRVSAQRNHIVMRGATVVVSGDSV